MNHATPHPSGDTLIRAMDGELPETLCREFEAHLAHCDECEDRLAALRAASDDASALWLAGAERNSPAFDDMRARLRAALAARSTALERSWRFRSARWFGRLPAAAIAAAAVLVIASGALLVRDEVKRHGATAAPTQIEQGALPIPALTPGATAAVTAADLCAGRAPSNEDVAPAIRQAVLRDYGMEGLSDADYELDHLITPELGGSSDRRNLWPERYSPRVWNARVKDELERLLPSLVCRGAVELTTAQREIAADWIAAYKKYFHTDRPVLAQARLLARN
jgi:anti-sigma factor RsiW